MDDPERFDFLLDGAAMMNANKGEIPKPPACLASLFETRCGMAGCHLQPTQHIDLVSPDVADRLIDKKSTMDPCKDYVFVASDGTDSLLLQKVNGTALCGVPMPLGGKLSADELKCMSDWVSDVSDAKGGGS